jgi:hypothetical protein
MRIDNDNPDSWYHRNDQGRVPSEKFLSANSSKHDLIEAMAGGREIISSSLLHQTKQYLCQAKAVTPIRDVSPGATKGKLIRIAFWLNPARSVGWPM